MALEEERLEEGKKTHKKVERNNGRMKKQWAKVRLKTDWIGKDKKRKKIKEYVPVIEGNIREEENEGKQERAKMSVDYHLQGPQFVIMTEYPVVYE